MKNGKSCSVATSNFWSPMIFFFVGVVGHDVPLIVTETRLSPALERCVCWGYYFMWQLRNSFGRPVMLQPEAPPHLTITPEQGVITQDSETAWDSRFLLQLHATSFLCNLTTTCNHLNGSELGIFFDRVSWELLKPNHLAWRLIFNMTLLTCLRIAFGSSKHCGDSCGRGRKRFGAFWNQILPWLKAPWS